MTAGASAPDHLVREVIAAVDPVDGFELFHLTEEGEYFPLPRQLRGFLAALSAAVAIGYTARSSADEGPLDRDRDLTATDALEVIR